MLKCLELAERPTERLPLLGVSHGLLQRTHADAGRDRGGTYSFCVEVTYNLREGLADVAYYCIRLQVDVFEFDFAYVITSNRKRLDALHVNARQIAWDVEHGHPARPVGARSSHNDQKIAA
jgi:hypothetical protein